MLHPYPQGVWCRSATALALVATAAPQLVAWSLNRPAYGWVHAATVAQLVAACLCVVAAALIYFQYRVRRWPALGWLAVCMTAYGVHGVTIALTRASGSGHDLGPEWALVFDLAIAVAVAAVAWLSRSRALQTDPLAVGMICGLALAALHVELALHGPPVSPQLPIPVMAGAVLALWLWAAWRLVNTSGPIGSWMAQRVAIGFVALTLSRLGAVLVTESTGLNAITLGCGTVGAVLVLSAALAGLRHEIQQHADRLATLDDRIARMEEQQRDQRSRLHEITNTVAGIAGASDLIHNQILPEPRRRRLEEMLDSEAARLTRILAGQSDATGPTAVSCADEAWQTVDLDAILGPLVAAQEALGRRVQWEQSGLRAVASPDALSEALNVLLDNARKHAPGSATTIRAQHVDGCVEVTVADGGPGVPEELGDRVFAPGAHGLRSRGQGLGLHLARCRADDCGGTLELVRGPGRGARFVLRLQAAPGRHGAGLIGREAS